MTSVRIGLSETDATLSPRAVAEEMMPRNMSFMLTTKQVRKRTKTVTRRLGWNSLKPGDLVWAVEKAIGLRKGEHVKRIALIRIVSVRRERLNAITQDDCRREGFPNLTVAQFVWFFCYHNKTCQPNTLVNRIEFQYVLEASDDSGR